MLREKYAQEIESLLKRYPAGREKSAVLPLLHIAQQEYGYASPEAIADVASILIDLTQRETMNKSSKFADLVVKNLHPKINKLEKTHRYAGFRVLKAPDIPSVLIELGFLTNEKNEHLLLTAEYRERVVESVVKGIDRFYAGE